MITQRATLVRQPFSSSSESSEFYNPPAEPHLSTNIAPSSAHSLRQSESLQKQSNSIEHISRPGTAQHQNFTILESTSTDPPKSELEVINHNGSISEHESSRDSSFDKEKTCQEEYVEDHSIQRQATSTSLDELDRCGSGFARASIPISKSEANLQERKSLELARKNVSSAPVTKEALEQFNNGNYESDNSLSKPSLPGMFKPATNIFNLILCGCV